MVWPVLWRESAHRHPLSVSDLVPDYARVFVVCLTPLGRPGPPPRGVAQFLSPTKGSLRDRLVEAGRSLPGARCPPAHGGCGRRTARRERPETAARHQTRRERVV